MKDKTFLWTLIIGIWLITSIQIFVTLGNRNIGKVNQTYNRATNCFAATSPAKRTPEHVKECYDKAELATGTKVDRYGDAK